MRHVLFGPVCRGAVSGGDWTYDHDDTGMRLARLLDGVGDDNLEYVRPREVRASGMESLEGSDGAAASIGSEPVEVSRPDLRRSSADKV